MSAGKTNAAVERGLTRRAFVGRAGFAHLLCLFVMLMTSLLTLAMIDGSVSRWAAVRNVHEYDRAQYLAAAAVHQAVYELEEDSGWRGPIADTTFPAGGSDTFAATVTEDGGELTIVGVGSAGAVTRTISVTVTVGG